MLSVRANDRGATPVGDVEVESRIRGNVYVRFGEGLTGDLTETPRFLFGPPVVNGQFLAVGHQWCRGKPY
jgi:hypothetical protein